MTTDPCKHFFGGAAKGDAKRTCHWCGAPEVLDQKTAIIELKRDSSEPQFGPAMRACTAMQQRFVLAMLDVTNGNATEAARISGYSPGGTETGLRSQAYRLAHDDKVQAAIHEESQKRLNFAGMMALHKLVAMVEAIDPENPHKGALKAVEMVLNRAGLHAKSEHKVVVESSTDAEMVARIKALSADLGLDAKKLLGAAGKTIDADFSEVKE